MTGRTFYDVFVSRVVAAPDSLQFRFIERAGEIRALTRMTLWNRASAIARQPQLRRPVRQRVMLACGSQYHFVLSLFACLLAGAVAVPAPPLTSRRLADRIRLMTADAGATVIVVDSDAGVAAAKALGVAVIDLRRVAEDDLPDVDPRQWPRPEISASSIALLQYTSGSTGEPKGVMVSHANLLANCDDITAAMDADAHARILVPLPLFHDMGLIGGVLQPLSVGCEATFIEPAQVVVEPALWLQAIHKYRITHSGAPNYLYDLAAGLEDAAVSGLDLSSWRVAPCGAEPVRARTLARFARRYQGHGFRSSAHFPCYGLAECTLLVAGAHCTDAMAPSAVEVSNAPSCGRPCPNTQLLIVDPASGTRLPEGRLGEIWLKGPSVAQGYWGHADSTQDAFGAHLAGDSEDAEPYLRTGDTGMLRDGQLYVQDRLKDLIDLRGRTFAPQEIEYEVACAHEAVQFCAAFSYNIEEVEHVAVVAETARRYQREDDAAQAVTRAIRDALYATFLLRLTDIELVPAGTVPRTSSGKVRRSRAREEFLVRRAVAARAWSLPTRRAMWASAGRTQDLTTAAK
jgi:acyl-CoA synthetase (AMP-forming)/AMP-acid ligase II